MSFGGVKAGLIITQMRKLEMAVSMAATEGVFDDD